jgi:hypothetical protein
VRDMTGAADDSQPGIGSGEREAYAVSSGDNAIIFAYDYDYRQSEQAKLASQF